MASVMDAELVWRAHTLGSNIVEKPRCFNYIVHIPYHDLELGR